VLEATGMKHTNRFVLFGNMYASEDVYIPDEIISGSFFICSRTQLNEPWEEYNGTFIWLEADSEERGYYDMDDKEFWDAVEKEVADRKK